MSRNARFQLAGFLSLLIILAAACGQKPGVAEEFAGVLPPGAAVNEQGQIVDAQGNVIGSAGGLTGGGGLGGTAVGGTTTGGTSGGTTGGTTGGGTTGGTTGGGTTGGGTSGGGGSGGGATDTGVTDDTIKIGSHAPITGAAPVPSDSAQKGSDVYWKWLKENKQTINGRYVESELKNDNYNPSQAVAVCKEMVERDKVFLLSGVAGTDQIQACARYAASVGVPYLSAGVTEIGLTGLPNYFTLTMTYPDQGPLLADYLVTKLGAKGEKNGMLRYDTPNFQDAHDAFMKGMKSKGARVHYDRAVSKGSGSTEAQTVVQEMKAAGIENVYPLVAPVWLIQVMKAADTQNYHPQWVGVGITTAFDTVASASCPAIDKGKFFSPYPAWLDINRFDPDFQKAIRAIYPEECGASGCGDDFMVLGWGASRQIGLLLENGGKVLTREGFIAATEKARNVKAPGMPVLNFSQNDHFGANQVHVSEARCSDRRWHTIMSYVSDF